MSAAEDMKAALRQCQQAIEAFLEFGKAGGDTSWQNHQPGNNPQDIFYSMMVANGRAKELLK